MKRARAEPANERVKRQKLGGSAKLFKAEITPTVAREGAKQGDILVGTSKTNFGLAIQVLNPVKPFPRRGHLMRVVRNKNQLI
jgi:hypothetical protein